ncbi:hypothetical protein [Pseudomonas nitroreducens]|uniref:hypothetical protein n=1 Tax=Pseudomonas nitroreducens TaxID=46680 RepID=UPI001FB5AD23|nr:hypothetical protein [Pseudomonas nitroreducens]MCJ1881132.1 hypothetical protein [Pseudomonas nitroreducens]MCJ1895808.1 hypothetical protein [Pseudomonas nitroreducens]
MTTQHTYGDSAIEFFPYDDNELQEQIQKAENSYYNSVKSPVEVNKLAASMHFHRGPLAVALSELIQLVQEGYSIRNDRFVGMNGGALDVTLSLPQELIDADLVRVHEQAAADYNAARFERNRVETEYQIGVTLTRAQREEEKKLAAAAEKAANKARAQALEDLRQAYAA